MKLNSISRFFKFLVTTAKGNVRNIYTFGAKNSMPFFNLYSMGYGLKNERYPISIPYREAPTYRVYLVSKKIFDVLNSVNVNSIVFGFYLSMLCYPFLKFSLQLIGERAERVVVMENGLVCVVMVMVVVVFGPLPLPSCPYSTIDDL
jgi:hypothetical protein